MGFIAFASFPVNAGVFDDEEARERIEKLRGEFVELSTRVETATRNQIGFANQAELIKAELAKLRGQIEVITYELETTQKRQRDFYIDLDNRLRKLEPPALADGKPAAVAATADPAAAETRDYEAALTLFKGANYKDALSALQGFIKNYPSSAMLPNAYYWAASAQYQLREYAKATELFAKVANTWPNDAKAADARLNQANSQQDAGDGKGARKTLKALIEQYPDSNAAKTAKLRLKKK